MLVSQHRDAIADGMKRIEIVGDQKDRQAAERELDLVIRLEGRKLTDEKRAEYLAELFRTVGLELTLKDLSASWSGARDSRPNTFEIWFGKPPLAPACVVRQS